MSGKSVNSIEHKGFIERFTDHSAFVRIVSESACASCHAKGACTAADMQNKEIEVNGIFTNFSTGEMVNLIMEQSQGFKALLLGYVYPFLILFTGLLTASSAGLSELASGLLAIGLLPPYYIILYLLRKKIRKSFNFSIRKID
jgi:sigma-E factor negative regulatory protein RseC